MFQSCVMTLLLIAIDTECLQYSFNVHIYIYNLELPLGTYIVCAYVQ